MSNDLSSLRQALADRAIELVTYTLGMEPNRKLSNRHETRWGNRGSFRLTLKGKKRGLWFDYEANEGGDLLELVRRRILNNAPFPEVVAWARRFTGESDHHISLPARLVETLVSSSNVDAQIDDRKQRQALAIWERAIAPDQTPASKYILDTRKIPIQTWPDIVRFDPHENTAVFKATNSDGVFAGIQRIYITAEGLNVKEGEKNSNKKRSLGPIGNSAVRLPGNASGPLLIAEGPETGLSIWCATGYETWISLGSVSNLAPPAGRLVVICHDDDPLTVKGGALRAVQKAKRQWLDEGLTVLDAWPWEIARGDKSDFNDVMKIAGIEEVAKRINISVKDPILTSQHLVSLEDARHECSKAVSDFFEDAIQWHQDRASASSPDCSPVERAVLLGRPAPTHAIRLTVGGGKTEAVLRSVLEKLLQLRANGDRRAIVIAVPQHRLSTEIAQRFESCASGTTLTAAIWRGREAQAPDASEQKMCRNIELAHEAAALWADMEKEVCPSCSYYNGCKYLAQRGLDGDLWIVAHQMIFHQLPGPIESRGIYALVIDESFWRAGLFGLDHDNRLEVSLDELAPGRVPVPGGNGPNSGERLEDLRDRLRQACANAADGPLRLKALLDLGFEISSAQTAVSLEYRRKDDQQKWRERKHNRSLRRIVALWEALADFLASESTDSSGRLTVVMRPGPNGTEFRAIRITGRYSVLKKWRVPTLLIDANLEPVLAEYYFAKIDKLTTIEVISPHMRILQATDRAFGKSQLFQDGKANVTKFRKLRAFVLDQARQTDGEFLVIANKAVIAELNLPTSVHTAHFNALAGRDEWRSVRKIVIIGRPQPSPAVVEAIAGALTGSVPRKIGQNWYPKRDAYRLVQEGEDQSTAALQYCRVDGHIDPIVEKLRQQIAEGELVQAIGRGRGVQRTTDTPLEVLLLTDLVLPIPISGTFPSREATNPRAAILMLAEGGVAFDDASAASKAYPQLWKTPAAARQALHRERCVTRPYEELNGSCHTPPGSIPVMYQLTGSGRRPATAFIDPMRLPDPRSAIERVLGPLVSFEIIQDEMEPKADDLRPLPETVATQLSEEAKRAVALFQAHGELLTFRSSGLEKSKVEGLRNSATHLIRFWASELVELEWDAETVFGGTPLGGRQNGLVDFLNGERVRAIGPEHAITQTGRIYDRLAA